MMIKTKKTYEVSWKRILMEIYAGYKENKEKFCGVLIKNKEESAKQPSKVIKLQRFDIFGTELKGYIDRSMILGV